MKKLTLIALCVLSIISTHAQTFSTDSGTVAKVVGWNIVMVPNYITNTTTSAFTITWHVVSTDFLPGWGGYYGVCDNRTAYTSPAVSTNYTSDYYDAGVKGDFHAFFDMTNAPIGAHYVTVSLTGASYIKTLTFTADKELRADSIRSSVGHTLCDTATLTLPLASVGSNIIYNWQYSTDSISWYTVSTTNKYHITDPRDHGYYRAILSATGYTITDTSKVFKLNPPPTATISIAAIPDTAITPGTLVNFVATVANVGSSPSYQWSKNGIDIPSATVNSYVSNTLKDNDVIECRVNGLTYCNGPDSAKSNKLTMHVSTGIEITLTDQLLSIYPNPNAGIFNIHIPLLLKRATVEITNTLGQVVYKNITDINHSLQLNTANLPAGIYRISVACSGTNYNTKFVLSKQVASGCDELEHA